MNRTYGRIQPDPLPAHRMLTRYNASIPAVDLRPFCGPIKDQGNLGSCTGHAFSSGMEWIFRKYFDKGPILSPLFLYACELIAQGSFPDDDGSDGTTGSEVTIVSGCCEDALYPDSSLKIEAPTPEMYQNAAQYKMGAYHGLTGSPTAVSVLADPVPWPVMVGFTVYESFESSQVAKSGIYQPGQGEQVLGGHEVLMVGYDIGPTPTIRPQGAGPSALIQNSWGSEWGDKGYFWMALSVLDDPQTDLKIVHSGHPWK